MYMVPLAIVICLISYILGCFSSASILAKRLKYKNIYKIGSGLADCENIYLNISKTLGIMCGVIDFTKMLVYLWFIQFILSKTEYSCLHGEIMLFVFGFFYIAGHCLPIHNKFKGGRGIFSYIALVMFFMRYEMIGVVVIAAILIWVFKQYRFAQYFIVLVPPVISFLSDKPIGLVRLMTITALLMGVLNYLVSKRFGEL